MCFRCKTMTELLGAFFWDGHCYCREHAPRGATEITPTNLRYKCPRCGAVSANPNDVVHMYCGRCHAFAQDYPAPPVEQIVARILMERARPSLN